MAGIVTLVVEKYPLDGATSLVVEEYTSYGWIEVLDTSSIGTYPDYEIEYEVTGTGWEQFRYKWGLSSGQSTPWFSPRSVTQPAIAATPEIEARLEQAVVAKAVRIYALSQAPLGTHGEMTEYGVARVMPDYQIAELLTGLIRTNWDVDLPALFGADDSGDPYGSGIDLVVEAMGYQSVPAGKEAALRRAVESAISWVAEYVLGAVPV